jgi:hypothetical protein
MKCAGKDVVEPRRECRRDGPDGELAGESSFSVVDSSSAVVTMMVMGTALDLSNRVEELEKEDLRVLTGSVLAGELER